MKHKLQHPELPTWCIYCGTFAEYCDNEEECTGGNDPQWDSRLNPDAMTRRLFGASEKEQEWTISQ